MIDEINSRPSFPDVTVCNLNPFVTLDDETISMNEYFQFVGRKNFTKSNFEDLMEMKVTDEDYEEIAGQMESVAGFHQNSQPSTVNKDPPSALVPFILSCKWYDWKWGERKNNASHNCTESLQAFRSPDYALCYTIKAVPESDIRGLTLVLYLNETKNGHVPRYHPNLGFSIAAGARVSVQLPGTMPDNKNGINVSPGHETMIRLHTTEHNRMPEPYGRCMDAQNETWSSGRNLSYTQSTCMGLCLQDQIIEECRCVNVLLQHTQKELDNFDYCGTIPNLTQIIKNHSQDSWEKVMEDETIKRSMYDVGQKLVCANSYVANMTDCQDKCLHPCHEVSYTFSVTQAPWPHRAYTLALFERLMKDNPTLGEYFSELSQLVTEWQDHDDQVVESDSKKWDNPQVTGGTVAETDIVEQEAELPSQDPVAHISDMAEETGAAEAVQKNFLQVKILFSEATSIEVEQKEKVSLVSALGNVGGIMNLWIGITFMTVMELCELCFKIVSAWKQPRTIQNEGTMQETRITKLPKVG